MGSVGRAKRHQSYVAGAIAAKTEIFQRMLGKYKTVRGVKLGVIH